jgi:hypothetical protein
MKKIMFVAAVAAAFAASADGIESSNTVGYGQNGLRFGYSLVTAQFSGVGGTNLSLDSLSASGTDASDNVTLATVDEYGTPIDVYAWNDWLDADNPCWVDGSFTPVENVSFAPGVGLWTSGSNNSQFIRLPAPEL